MTRVIRSEADLSRLLARPGYRVASEIGGGNELQSGAAVARQAHNLTVGGSNPPSATITLPWPPSGNHAHNHTARGGKYLRPEVIAYRDGVASLCAGKGRVTGKYRLHVHLSPPDARRRDADNALKQLLDALTLAGYIEDDSLSLMRELVVTVDDDRHGNVKVRAMPVVGVL